MASAIETALTPQTILVSLSEEVVIRTSLVVQQLSVVSEEVTVGARMRDLALLLAILAES